MGAGHFADIVSRICLFVNFIQIFSRFNLFRMVPNEIEKLFRRVMADNQASRKDGSEQPNDIYQMLVQLREKQSELNWEVLKEISIKNIPSENRFPRDLFVGPLSFIIS